MSFRLLPDVFIEDVDGTSVLLTEKGDAAVLNSSASMILETLCITSTRDEAINSLLGIYAADELALKNDVNQLVNQLSRYGMIEELG